MVLKSPMKMKDIPEIGEMKSSNGLGLKTNEWYIWHACIDCGKERWVAFDRKRGELKKRDSQKSRTGRCRNCSQKFIALSEHCPTHKSSKGGRVVERGYVKIMLYPDDFFFPMAHKTKTRKNHYVLEHRLVMAKHLGRCLQDWEIVHHKGTKYPTGSLENRSDNRIENLQIVTDDRHRQITILENKIIRLGEQVEVLQKRVTLLEAELVIGNALRAEE